MKKVITLLLLTLMIFASGFSQKKLVIEDQAELISQSTDSLLGIKFSENNFEYTSLVDFKNKCDYSFALLTLADKAIYLSVKDCKDNEIGNRNLGSRIRSGTDIEKTILISNAVLEIIENPGELFEVANQKIIKSENNTTQTDTGEELFNPLNNEHNTRHFFSPTAKNLRQGELYYNTIYFLIHDAQYGISDNFSIGMGTTIAGIPFYLTPKLTFPLGEKSTVAIGDLFVLGTYGVNFTGNLVYGIYTYGSDTKNITMGLGYISVSGEDLNESTSNIVFNMAGMIKISDYVYFISENYFLNLNISREANFDYYDPENDYSEYHTESFMQHNSFLLGITGFRFISRKRDVQSWQIGLTYAIVNQGEVPSKYKTGNWHYYGGEGLSLYPFPTVSFTWKFGKKF